MGFTAYNWEIDFMHELLQFTLGGSEMLFSHFSILGESFFHQFSNVFKIVKSFITS
jgi:hypothetical protein